MTRRWLWLSTQAFYFFSVLLLSNTLVLAGTPSDTGSRPAEQPEPPKIILTVLDPQHPGVHPIIAKFIADQTRGDSHVAAVVPAGQPELVELAQSLAPPGTRVLAVKDGHAIALGSVRASDESAAVQAPSPSAIYRVALALFRGGGVAVLTFVGVNTTQPWEVAAAVGLVSGLMSGLLQFHNIPFVQWLLRGNFFARWVGTEVVYLSVARLTLEGTKRWVGSVAGETLSMFQNFVLQRMGLPIPEAIVSIAENTVMGMLSQGILDNANSVYFRQQTEAYLARAQVDPALSHLTPDQLLRRPEYQRIMLFTDIRTSLISAISMGFVLSNLAGVPYADISLWVMTGMGIVAKFWVNRRGRNSAGPGETKGLSARLRQLRRCSVLP